MIIMFYCFLFFHVSVVVFLFTIIICIFFRQNQRYLYSDDEDIIRPLEIKKQKSVTSKASEKQVFRDLSETDSSPEKQTRPRQRNERTIPPLPDLPHVPEVATPRQMVVSSSRPTLFGNRCAQPPPSVTGINIHSVHHGTVHNLLYTHVHMYIYK